MITGPNWNRWVEAFRLRLKQKLEIEGLEQRDVAERINVPPSTFSAQMHRTLKPWFVDRIAELWPDDFGDDPLACRQEMLGVPNTADLTHLRSLLLFFHEIRRQADEGIETITALLESAKKDRPVLCAATGKPVKRARESGA